MSPRSFYKLLIVTLATLVVAVAFWILTPEYSAGTFFGEPLFPGLIEKLNDVEVVSVEHGGRTLTFLKDETGGWSLMEENGYPADKERIRNALIGLAHLEKIEPKTSLPEFYPDLHVEDNSTENAQSHLITLLKKDGQQITGLLVGKKINGITWNGQGYFVRFPNEAQSWLVRGNIDVTGGSHSWMATRILPLTAGRAGTITVIDGSKTREGVYKRTDPALPILPSFTSDGYIITSLGFIKRMEEALTSFDFESVAPRPAELAQTVPFSSFLIETLDGLRIYMFLYLENSIPYAAVSFVANEDAADAVKAEAAELENIHNKWLYRMPVEKISPILPFLAVPKEEKAAAEIKTKKDAGETKKESVNETKQEKEKTTKARKAVKKSPKKAAAKK